MPANTAYYVAFVAKFAPWVVHVAHLHISDQIQALTCTDAFKKLTFLNKEQEK